LPVESGFVEAKAKPLRRKKKKGMLSEGPLSIKVEQYIREERRRERLEKKTKDAKQKEEEEKE